MLGLRFAYPTRPLSNNCGPGETIHDPRRITQGEGAYRERTRYFPSIGRRDTRFPKRIELLCASSLFPVQKQIRKKNTSQRYSGRYSGSYRVRYVLSTGKGFDHDWR